MDDSIYILSKVLKEHKDKETEFYSTLNRFLGEGGWLAMAGAMTPSRPLGILTYPNVKMPNGTLTQGFTSIGSDQSLYQGEFLLSSASNVDYDFTLSFSPPRSFDPDIVFSITDSSGGAVGGFPNMTGKSGFAFLISSTNTSHPILSTIRCYSGGVMINQVFIGSVTCDTMRVYEHNGTITLQTGPSIETYTFPVLPMTSSLSRYFQIYRNDNSSVAGQTFNVSIIA